MVKVELEKWGCSLSDLHNLATQSPHYRTRERFFALYQIASGVASATSWALQINRSDEAVLQWLHKFNERGPIALDYRRTGGRPRFLKKIKPTKLSKR